MRRKRRVLSARRKSDGSFLLVLECLHVKTVSLHREGSHALCMECNERDFELALARKRKTFGSI